MIRIFYTCAFFVSFQFFALAQNSDRILIDSISNVNSEQLDSLYYRLFLKHRTENLELAEEYATLSYEYAEQYNHKEQFVKAGNALGYILNEVNNYTGAEKYYLSALETALDINYERYLIFIPNNLGNLYNAKLSQYDKAIEYYLMSLDYAQKFEKPESQAVAFNNIGLVYYRLGNYTEALNYHKNVIAIKNQHGITEDIYINHNNLGLSYNAAKNYDEAIESFDYVLENCSECPNSILAEAYLGLGNTYFDSKDYDEAIEYFIFAKSLYEKDNNLIKKSSVDYFLAKIYYEMGDVDKAIALLENSQESALQVKSARRLKSNYELYADIFENQGDYILAYGYLKNFIVLKDSIFNEELAENLKDAHIAFQQSQTDEVIRGKEDQIKKSRNVTILLGVISVLSFIILLFAYRDIVYRRKVNEKLDKLVKAKTKELVTSNTKLVKSRKDLDTFLYKTSHDIRGPLATLMGLTNLAKIESGDVETSGYLEKINSTALNLNDVINRLTSISQISSQPVKPDNVNIYAMVNNIVDRSRNKIKYNISFKLSDSVPDSVKTDKVLLEFILASLIDNAFKYYDPSEKNCYVELNISLNDAIYIQVKDNGAGIDAKFKDKVFDLFFVANEKQHGAGIGLYQAMLATERLNGNIQLNRIRKPTIFSVNIPLE
ncbi:tetratricopeptide repeat protein [Bacteroidota bacterium]